MRERWDSWEGVWDEGKGWEREEMILMFDFSGWMGLKGEVRMLRMDSKRIMNDCNRGKRWLL